MLKTLTLSLSLAVALGFCSVSKAGGLFHNNDGCSTCGLASPQGPVVSSQAPCASPQGECGMPSECGRKKCHLFEGLCGMGNKMNCSLTNLCNKLKPKPPVYTYEWVLKKKRVWCHKSNPCGSPACDTCSGIYPSGQGAPSPQGGYGSPQAGYSAPTYGAGQSYGTGQAYNASGYSAPAYSGHMTPAPAAGGDEAPPAPEVAPSVPSAPSAPSVPSVPSVPGAPTPPPPPATSGLLFSTPTGN